MRKFILSPAFIATALALTACGDDSSSNASDSNTENLNIQINETEKKAIVTLTYNEKLCITNEARTSFQFKSIGDIKEYQGIKYDFANDTLLLYLCEHSDFAASDISFTRCSTYGDAYVGGKAGSPYGTWIHTGCEISNGFTECSNENYADHTLKISNGSIKVTYNNENDYNLAESEYLENLIYFLKYGSSYPSVRDLFNTGYPDISAQEYGIAITKKSTTKATLVVGTNNVNVSVDKLQEDPDIIKLTVTSGNITCNLDYVDADAENMTKDMCKASNAEFFDYDYDSDMDGNKIYFVEDFERNNKSEFRDCLEELQQKVSGLSNAYLKNIQTELDGNNHKNLKKLLRKLPR